MSTRILCVDDDANVLAGYQRSLRKQFQLDTALGGEAGLELIGGTEPYAVVVADMNMPGMNGIQFLTRVRELAPDTVRFMLTGNADQQTAMQAVNQGHVFQFLTKPCPPELLAQALTTGIKQYRLITAERELLEKTLNGSIQVLTDVLSMADAPSFGVGRKLREYMNLFATTQRLDNPWELELAAMLSQIGYVTIPAEVLQKHRSGFGLTGPEKDMLDRLPEVGSKLVAHIPRLAEVARIVRYQNKHFDGSGFPMDAVAGDSLPLGSRILRVMLDLLQFEAKGTPRFLALEEMRQRAGRYDPKVLEAVFTCFDLHLPEKRVPTKEAIPFSELRVGHVLVEKVETTTATIVAGPGTEVTQMVLEKLANFDQLDGLKEPIYVRGETDAPAAAAA